jgi:rod shape determining protein RodA
VQSGGQLLEGVPIVLVFVQPDFGTAIVFTLCWFLIAWIGGLRLWQLAFLLLATIPTSVYGWTHVLQPYQHNRLLIFMDPVYYDPDLKYGAWNIIQSLTAIGSGGLTGHGWTHGLLTQGNYLPVQYSDFIFAVTGEELGFIGTTALLLFEAVLIWQALAVARVARDTFGRLIAVGIAALFMCHLLVNAGMNMSIMPITGIPLPFISYGGSFTLTTFAAIGLLQSIALHRRRIVF